MPCSRAEVEDKAVFQKQKVFAYTTQPRKV